MKNSPIYLFVLHELSKESVALSEAIKEAIEAFETYEDMIVHKEEDEIVIEKMISDLKIVHMMNTHPNPTHHRKMSEELDVNVLKAMCEREPLIACALVEIVASLESIDISKSGNYTLCVSNLLYTLLKPSLINCFSPIDEWDGVISDEAEEPDGFEDSHGY